MSKMSSNLRASTTFVWSTNNILGKGATGCVYQGINKMTGEAVAVKTFNQLSHMRPYDVQVREFDVLKKVKQENIVKLLAIESELETQFKILVMELCTGGSLFTILDDPENTFGLCEDEFLLVLKHLSDGMKHLRDNNIVHRDLKPGNIMKYITEDGRSIYKLTDFGAARELEDDQQFMSLYGTEEYLHPDMYERAVLRKLAGKAFGATVDLWSIGVTLYHVATGSLPFRPYGGRKNKETMYYITTEKESGVISGVQTTENGPIEWSRELPATCQLSMGLRKFVTPLLAGLMECDSTRMWTFEHFFAEASNLLQRCRLFVFHVEKCRSLSLYVDPNDRLEEVRCLIFEQTDLSPERQCLLYGNKLLEDVVGFGTPVSSYPQTKPGNPIFLLATTDSNVAVEDAVIPKFANFSNVVAVDQDSLICKSICSVGYCMKRSVERTTLIHQLLKSVAALLNTVCTSHFASLKSELDHTDFRSSAATQKTRILANCHKTTCALLDSLGNLEQTALEEKNKLQLLVNSKQESNTTVARQLAAISHRLMASHQKLVEEQQLWNQWKDGPVYKQDLSGCPARATTYVQTLKSCWQHLARNRNSRGLSYSDEQFHMLEKLKARETKQKLVRLHQEECQATLRDAIHHFGQWLSTAQKALLHAKILKSDLEKFVEMLKVHDCTLDEASETYDQMSQGLVVILNRSYGALAESVREREIVEREGRLLDAKKRNATRYLLEGLKEISHSHSEIMTLVAENHSLMTQLQATTLNIHSLQDVMVDNKEEMRK